MCNSEETIYEETNGFIFFDFHMIKMHQWNA